jgi:hypothetical protein
MQLEGEVHHSSSAVVLVKVNHYDGLGRLQRIESDRDGDGKLEQVEVQVYDELGRLVSLEGPEYIEKYQLDREGRVAVRETYRKGGALIAREVISYDEHGKKLREVGELDDIRYTYDGLGREIREHRVRLGEEEPYLDYATSYDTAGHRLRRSGFDPSGKILETWEYDGAGREVRSAWFRDGGLLLRTQSFYDLAGRRVREESWNSEGKQSGRRLFFYDLHGDLQSERTENLEAGIWEEERYSYSETVKCAR